MRILAPIGRRKLMRILVGFFMISLVRGNDEAADAAELAEIGLKVSFEIIGNIIGWGMKIYGTIESYRNPDKSRENIITIMRQVEEVSTKLDALESHLDIKLDSMLNTLLSDIKLEVNLNQLKGKFRNVLSKIDNYFDKSREYKIGGPFGNDTIQSFAQKALWSTGSVPDFLEEMHDVFVPGGAAGSGYLSVLLEHALLNRQYECDTHFSAHQKTYYIYIHLIIAEIKGLLTQQHCLNIKFYFNDSAHNYIAELQLSKRKFVERMRQYFDLFRQLIDRIPHQIRRCEVHGPQRGEHFAELERFSRITLLDPYIGGEDCFECPGRKRRNAILRNKDVEIYNCQKLGTTLTSCPAPTNTSRDYLWWKSESDGSRYGSDEACAQSREFSGGEYAITMYRGASTSHLYCQVCACSIDMNHVENDDPTVWRISLREQISEIMKNKVVTAVRFVIRDKAIHLQIKQAKFSANAMHYKDFGWKDLDSGHYFAGVSPMNAPHYENLRHDRKTLYLDDISAPSGHAVTGVRFAMVDDVAFKLQIFVSEFDLETGNIFPFGSRWIDASTHPKRAEDYKRQRVEINMGASADPTRASEFRYDIQSNKMIKFTHTDLHKDAGQTTIPFLDTQSVETHPQFPLGGVGLSFRGRDGFGGFIAPRIYTINTARYLKFPDINENN